MGYPIHPLSNAGVAGQYLNQLTSDNISQRYFSGQQSYTGGLFNRIKLFFNIDGTLNELKNFYPYVPIVKSSHEVFTSESANALTNSLAITALSWYKLKFKQVHHIQSGTKGKSFAIFQSILHLLQNSPYLQTVFIHHGSTLCTLPGITQP